MQEDFNLFRGEGNEHEDRLLPSPVTGFSPTSHRHHDDDDDHGDDDDDDDYNHDDEMVRL